MADIDLVRAEKGGEYVITIYDRNNMDTNGSPQLISFSDLGITQATLSLAAETTLNSPLLSGVTLVLQNDSQVVWTISDGQVPATGNNFWAIVDLLNSGGTLIRKTNLLTVLVQEDIG